MSLMFMYLENPITKEIYDILLKGIEDECYSDIFVFSSNSDMKKYLSYSNNKSDVIENLSNNKSGFTIISCNPDMNMSRSKDSEPIVKDNVYLFSCTDIPLSYVSLYKEQLTTDQASEVIIEAYKNYGNLKDALENIVGGWSFIMLDKNIDKIFISSSFMPMYELYIPSVGYFIHTNLSALNKILEKFRKTIKTKLVDIEPYTIMELDYDMNVNIYSYKHKFDHPIWTDEYTNKSLYMVLASSGLDSTTLLAYLKYKRKDIIAVYFDYNSVANEAEKIAIDKICNVLDIKLMTIDLSPIFRKIKDSSNLLNEDIKMNMVDTFNDWVPNRNEVFISVAATIAESLILTNKVDRVYISGGFPTIVDERQFPDCSRSFIKNINKVLKLSTLPGAHEKIKYINPLKNLKKTEMVALLRYMYSDIDLFSYTVSCDRPKIIDGEVYQCSKNNIPNCYAGLESYVACYKLGLPDTRKFYEIKDDKDDKLTKELIDLSKYTKEKYPTLVEILRKIKFRD
ncbi:MAG: 7-cyano-7-deazaguanine synthase [Nanopusillaceae archaeon]|jgi:7-cyano-7-deazaguanine synthase in queuosine biosynthesis